MDCTYFRPRRPEKHQKDLRQRRHQEKDLRRVALPQGQYFLRKEQERHFPQHQIRLQEEGNPESGDLPSVPFLFRSRSKTLRHPVGWWYKKDNSWIYHLIALSYHKKSAVATINPVAREKFPWYNARKWDENRARKEQRCRKMKDFPMFVTDWGVASLIFKEIPYKQIAYIRIQDVQPGHIKDMVQECAQFCRAAGAEIILASGHPDLSCYPYFGSVMTMRLSGFEKEPTDACLFPVTEQTVSRWRQIYNEKMRSIDFAATMTRSDEKDILKSGGAYFVHRNGKLLGIGWMEGSEVLAVAAAERGMGETVLRALMTLADSDTVTLDVAASNARAIRLYERMGFVTTAEKNRSYRIR